MNRGTFFLLILLNVIWAGSYAATKKLMDHAPFYLVTSLRFLIALGPMVFIAAAKEGLRMKAVDLAKCAVIGVATFTLCPVLMYAGVGISRAADAAILSAGEPLMVSIGAYLYLREKIDRRTAAGLIVAFAGVCLLSEFWAQNGSLQLTGTALIVLAVFFEAWYTVLGKELLARHSPIKVAAVSVLFACIVNSVALTFLGYWKHIPSFNSEDWFILAFYLAGLCTIVGYVFWFTALRLDSASKVAITIFTQPVIGILVAWAWVNETPTAAQILGTGVILLAVWIALGAKRKSEKEAAL